MMGKFVGGRPVREADNSIKPVAQAPGQPSENL